MWCSLLFFAFALNLDALGVGVSYGIKKIKLPLLSLVIICIVSMSAICVSMLAGHFISHVIPPELSKHVGGAILILLGIYAIYQYANPQNDNKTSSVKNNSINQGTPPKESFTLLQIRLLGLMIQILKEPHIVDVDQSGIISGREALLLGLALSLDSLGAGMAVSLLGYSIFDTAIFVGAGQFLFTLLGLKAGSKLSNSSFSKQIAVLPGLILIILGVSRFY